MKKFTFPSVVTDIIRITVDRFFQLNTHTTRYMVKYWNFSYTAIMKENYRSIFLLVMKRNIFGNLHNLQLNIAYPRRDQLGKAYDIPLPLYKLEKSSPDKLSIVPWRLHQNLSFLENFKITQVTSYYPIPFLLSRHSCGI